MGDVDDRQGEAVAQPLEKRKNLVLGRPVERRQRFVHQEELRLRQERASDRHALAFAAGEIARRAVEQRRHAEEIDDFVESDLLSGLGARPVVGAVADRAAAPSERGYSPTRSRRAEHEVAAHCEVREEARLLEHVAERPPVRRQKGALAVLPDIAHDLAKPVAQPQEAGDAA
jgi:hypothetical protein